VSVGRDSLNTFLKMTELLPGQVIRGYAETNGISQLQMTVAAREGQEVTNHLPKRSTPADSLNDINFWILLLLLGVTSIVILLLVIYAGIPVVNDLGLLETKNNSLRYLAFLFLLIILATLLGVFRVIPFRIVMIAPFQIILNGLILYIILTNYKYIKGALKNLATSVDKKADKKPL
jgi:hypothetical protein